MASKAMLTVFAVAGLASVAFLGGCADDRITAESVRSDMSPELESTAMTHEQRQNQIARAVDTTTRQIVDDWDMITMLDKPVRNTWYPIR